MWQRRRLRVLELADFTCQRCGACDTQLHAHHKVYVRGGRLWEYADHLLECLCDPCHDTVHAQKTKLELVLAQHPSARLPAITKLMAKLGAVLSADDPRKRVDAENALQDELDAIEDHKRGAGQVADPAEALTTT